MNDHQSLDPRSPWVISIHDLVRSAGAMKSLSREIPAPAGVGIELIRVPEGSPVPLELRLESVVEGVLVSGTVGTDLVGECARCLTEVSDHREFELQELYYYPGKDAEEDALFIVNEYIDLEQPMRDAVVLDLPFTPLCRQDCLGLCPTCGLVLNDDPEHNHGLDVDPRWDGLQGLVTEQDEA